MKESYSESELETLLANVSQRSGWDFSSMNTWRAPVPWDYIDEIKKRINPTDKILDIGTGGGERFLQYANLAASGLGVDIDPQMIEHAQNNARNIENVQFLISDENLQSVDGVYSFITNRHAPYDLEAIRRHLKSDGIFITQQVGEQNMANVRRALGQPIPEPPISKKAVEGAGFECMDFQEYDVEYVVKDIESLVFWLNALDLLHADLEGGKALSSIEALNKVLENSVDSRGFITNEHRYLVVAKLVN